MSNTVTTTEHLHNLDTREGCINAGKLAVNLLDEVVRSWVNQGFGTVGELAPLINKSAGHLRKVQAKLRKLGDLPPATHGRRSGAPGRALPVEKIKQKEEEKSDMELTTLNSYFNPQPNTQPENNVRLRHQQPERSLCTTGESDGGDIQRSDWFIPDGCPDPEALNAYHDIIHALDQAGELCSEWHSSRRIDEELWDSIAGHAQDVLSFAHSRIHSAPDVESDVIDVVGIADDSTEEGAQSTIKSD